MTAVAAPYEELLLLDLPLSEALVDQLGEDALTMLLLRRFRYFLDCGYREAAALLLAVGHTETDASFAVETLISDPPILH